jgi:molybdopterin synthase sulfur carrier subunit
MITVELPGALRPFAHGSEVVTLEERCATVGEALETLERRWPGVRDRILDEQGTLRPHVAVFVGEESIRYRGGLAAPLAEGSTIVILPAVSGG